MSKTMRNKFCPCGSRKKYKQCCLTKVIHIPSFEADLKWQNLRKLEGELWRGAYSFALEKWGPEILEDGWEAFCLDTELDRDSDDGKHLFPGWFIFRWIPYNHSEKWRHLGPNDTLADLYLKKTGSPEHFSFLSAVSESPFSFFLVQDVIPTRRLMLKDLLLGKSYSLKEKTGSLEEFKGKIVFGRVISFEEQEVQINLGTIALPLRYSKELFDLKKKILKKEKVLTPQKLLKYDDELRKSYFIWTKLAYLPPTLVNHEGDPIVLSTLQYRLSCSPQKAFEKLFGLYKGEKLDKELLEEGKFDKKGALISIDFPWLSNPKSNLLLGNITINRKKLSIFVNSINRSERIKKEIKKRLPEAVLIKTDRQTLEELPKTPEKSKAPSYQPTAEEKRMLGDYLSKHYENWLDTPLPFLEHKTPRQAAKTALGRERLECLLLDFEMSNEGKESHLQIDIKRLRSELGLLRQESLVSTP